MSDGGASDVVADVDPYRERGTEVTWCLGWDRRRETCLCSCVEAMVDLSSIAQGGVGVGIAFEVSAWHL